MLCLMTVSAYCGTCWMDPHAAGRPASQEKPPMLSSLPRSCSRPATLGRSTAPRLSQCQSTSHIRRDPSLWKWSRSRPPPAAVCMVSGDIIAAPSRARSAPMSLGVASGLRLIASTLSARRSRPVPSAETPGRPPRCAGEAGASQP
uniref:Uncharacterized protein n=1 Tax=uncultured marine virus TaxID=186617 RepID=A0A0F7LAC9_9VIRU|nr:hypothetical protein ACD_7C00302G0014 [uncultured marine virus]